MNPNQLPIIQSLWIGNKLAVMERLCITSFIKNGHPFHLYTYNDIEGIPKGTVIKDANHIIPEDKIFKYKNRDSYAGFANMFRYKLVLEKGNYWVDTDVICLRPFEDDSEYVFAQAIERKIWGKPQDSLQIESCIFKTPQGSEIMEFCLDESAKRNPGGLEWGETGPELLKRAVIMFGLTDYVSDPSVYCPIDWRDWDRLISSSIFTTTMDKFRMSRSGTKAIHLWNEMWRLNGVDKNASFHKRSIYEELKSRYLKND